MKKSQKILILLGLGGVITLGYYFLKKNKPTLNSDQLAKLNTDTISSIEESLPFKLKPTLQELGYTKSTAPSQPTINVDMTNIPLNPAPTKPIRTISLNPNTEILDDGRGRTRYTR